MFFFPFARKHCRKIDGISHPFITKKDEGYAVVIGREGKIMEKVPEKGPSDAGPPNGNGVG